MAFQKSWRTYQARLLERLDTYLADNRLHIVAAPGSGKTIFGIEVVRRLDQPTLILAPTITIRNQWLERLFQQFLPPGSQEPDWASTDIRNPRLFTVATYQALHALCAGKPDPSEDGNVEDESCDIPDSINENGKSASRIEVPECLSGFKTLVIDEAHHLRSEWWKSLTFIAEHLKPTLIALTATPPYDVSPYEWQRYEELCGPVDAEIAVPELVLQSDLCPHQDYVYLSVPDPAELRMLTDFRASVDTFVQELKANKDFAAAVAAHPWVADPDGHIEEILDNPEYLSSMVAYLKSTGFEIPKPVFRTLGASSESVPELDLTWLEILLTRCLFADADKFQKIDGPLKQLRHDLAQIGAIERRKVVLRNPSEHTKLLTASRTKLRSIEEIVRAESGSLSDKLRCAILTDYIRKSDLPRTPDDPAELKDVGAVPIFETLRRARIPEIHLGVLCGSLVIIPKSAEELTRRNAIKQGLERDLVFQDAPHTDEYLILQIAGENRQNAVRLITSVFEQGGVTVLIGTKSLLGEGWDAPTINTLILATFVGSFVLSNQMRGRSIRIDPNSPEKTANVWHLVCVEPGAFGPGDDYDLLERRCTAFVGVNASTLAIENGIERLGLSHPPYEAQQIGQLNAQTTRRALDRQSLRKDWIDALASGRLKQMTHGLKTNGETLPRKFVFRNTIAAILVQGVMFFTTIFLSMMRTLGRFHVDSDPLLVPTVILATSTIAGLPWVFIGLWRLMRHGTPERSLEQIGYTVLDALFYQGSITTPLPDLSVNAEHMPDGSVYCWLDGGTGRDQSIFLETLREALRPIANPRYLLAKRFLRFFNEDYFAVPEIVARKKENAEFFARKWSREVGKVQLVYTRSPEGRNLLLRARMRSLASTFQSRAERLSCWK
ncbi:MAG: DEAD/DEAH box helicase family protein [Acidobacteria bacterium]|nr:DEAD/DEAH box helicase family protein [Acidobacteriota bacterium]